MRSQADSLLPQVPWSLLCGPVHIFLYQVLCRNFFFAVQRDVRDDGIRQCGGIARRALWRHRLRLYRAMPRVWKEVACQRGMISMP